MIDFDIVPWSIGPYMPIKMKNIPISMRPSKLSNVNQGNLTYTLIFCWLSTLFTFLTFLILHLSFLLSKTFIPRFNVAEWSWDAHDNLQNFVQKFYPLSFRLRASFDSVEVCFISCSSLVLKCLCIFSVIRKWHPKSHWYTLGRYLVYPIKYE